VLITDIEKIGNQYLKQFLNRMGIKTSLQFKIENKENNLLYSFGIDF
jgi:predicted RNA-binding protein Jag